MHTPSQRTCPTHMSNALVHLHTRAGRATGSFNEAKYNGETEVDEEEEEEEKEEALFKARRL